MSWEEFIERLDATVKRIVETIAAAVRYLVEWWKDAMWRFYVAEGYPYGDHEDGFNLYLRFGCQRN
jgi:hypothetical protein